MIDYPMRMKRKRERRMINALKNAKRVLMAVDKWRGLDGDGITDPVREQVIETLKNLRRLI